MKPMEQAQIYIRLNKDRAVLKKIFINSYKGEQNNFKKKPRMLGWLHEQQQ